MLVSMAVCASLLSACVPAAAAEAGIVSFVLISDAEASINDPGGLPGIVRRVERLRVAPDFAVSLGNNIAADGGNAEVDVLAYQASAGRLPCAHYYCLGDNEWAAVAADDRLSWEELYKTWRMPRGYYSFDAAGLHVCVLDTALALSRPENAEALAAQAQWLEQDLAATTARTVILCHRSVSLQKGDVAHWTGDAQLEFWPQDNPLAQTLRKYAEKIVGVFEGDAARSFLREKHGLLHHQVGSASTKVRPESQFAQVFIELATGNWFVLGNPETIDQREQFHIQLTYGDRSLLKTVRQAREDALFVDDPEVLFELMMQDIFAADERMRLERLAVEELERELEALDREINASLGTNP
jgi:hypothetical protein